MFGEIIEAMIGLFKENETPLIVDNIALDVLDNAFAHGLIEDVQEDEEEKLLVQIKEQIRYYLHPGEEVLVSA